MRAVVLACLAAASPASPASADNGALYDRLWPRVPSGPQLTLSQQIQDQLTALGNTLGYHLDLLSHEMFTLRVDARARRASIRLGGGDSEHLEFRLASDVHFTGGLARIATRVDLGFRGHTLCVELPEIEMTPTEAYGERGLVVRLPLFRRNF